MNALSTFGAWLDTDSERGLRARLRWKQPPGYGFVELPGCAIRYRAHGAGERAFVFAADPPIVLEHYDALVAELAPHGRVVILELPGFGFSPASRAFDFGFDAATRAVIAFLEAIAVHRAVLAFPCLSGYLAANVASARPDLVSALVLAQTPSYAGALAWARSRDRHRILARPVVGQIAMHAMKRARVPDWFALAVDDPDARAALVPLAEDAVRRGARWSLATALQRFLVEGGAPPPVFQPLFAVWGRGDRSHAATDRDGSRALGRDVRLVEWDDAGHFPELERPRRFAGLVRAATLVGR